MDMSDLPKSSGPMLAVSGFTSGLQAIESIGNIQKSEQNQAIKLEEAQRTRAEYEDSMTPIHLTKLNNIVPPDMRDGMFDFLKVSGAIKVANDQPYVLKKDLKEFMTGFKTNIVAQNIILDKSHKNILAARAQLKPELDAISNEYETIKTNYQQKVQMEIDKVKDKMVGGKPMLPDKMKMQGIMEEFEKDPKIIAIRKRHGELQNTDLNLERTSDMRLRDMQIGNTRIDELAKTLGGDREMAYMVASQQTTMQEALMLKYKEKKRYDMDLIKEKEIIKESLRAKREIENIQERNKKPTKGDRVPAAVDTDKYLTSEAIKLLTETKKREPDLQIDATNIASYKTYIKRKMSSERALQKVIAENRERIKKGSQGATRGESADSTFGF
jgi:hypothetical protein